MEEKTLTKDREEQITQVGPPLEEALLEKVLLNILSSKEIPGQFGDLMRLTRLGVFGKFAQILSEHPVDDRIYGFTGKEINVKIASWVQEWKEIGKDIGWSEEAAITCIRKGLFAQEYQRLKPTSRRIKEGDVKASRYVTMCEDIRDSFRALERARLREKRTADKQGKRAAKEKEKLLARLNDFRVAMIKASRRGNWAGVKWQAKRIKNLERSSKIKKYTEEANSYIKLAQTELNGKTK